MRPRCWGSCCCRTWSAVKSGCESEGRCEPGSNSVGARPGDAPWSPKGSTRRFDGHKAAVIVDTDSQLITAVDVLAGNAADNTGALELVEASEENVGVDVDETMGDAAYGDGSTRQAFADAADAH